MKRFLRGLTFGAGFGLGFVVIIIAAWMVVFPTFVVEKVTDPPDPEHVLVPPAVTPETRFLGSSATFSGGFRLDTTAVLAGGPGRIVGLVTSDGAPVAGVRLRLGLNGTVLSQGATTGADGFYRIAVPYGEYRIDGFRLDYQSANAALPGKIGHPLNPVSAKPMNVAPDTPGTGLNLDYVDPVELDIPNNKISKDEPVIIRWKPYPGARAYKVQIYESADQKGYRGRISLFRDFDCPVVTEPFVDLRAFSVQMKPGRYYSVHVEARGENDAAISRTPEIFGEFDFQIVD